MCWQGLLNCNGLPCYPFSFIYAILGFLYVKRAQHALFVRKSLHRHIRVLNYVLQLYSWLYINWLPWNAHIHIVRLLRCAKVEVVFDLANGLLEAACSQSYRTIIIRLSSASETLRRLLLSSFVQTLVFFKYTVWERELGRWFREMLL